MITGLRVEALRCNASAETTGQQSGHHHQGGQGDYPLRGDGAELTR
jgi:hypothetical protein